MQAMFDSVPPGVLMVFLHHYPDEIYEVAKQQVDLYCAGHTHGGQVALPIYGALITFSRFGKRFESGLYKVEDTHLYVNRGIGMDGGFAPRVRFCARPEVTVIDIAAAK
jgi:predicted MPP superfamily phosphohydrolase